MYESEKQRRSALLRLLNKESDILSTTLAPEELEEFDRLIEKCVEALPYDEAGAAYRITGIRGIEQSVTYQMILKEGRAMGRAEAALERIRNILLELGEKRFGVPDTALKMKIEAMHSREQIEWAIVALVKARSWQEALQGEQAQSEGG